MGRKFLLVVRTQESLSFFDEKGRLSKELQFDVGKKYPRLGWVIWPVDVVEATPKGKHIYGKRVIYIPIWPYMYSGSGIAAADIYDRQMKLWKNYYFLFGRQEYLDGDPQKPMTLYSGALIADLQADHTTQMVYSSDDKQARPSS